MEASSEAPEEQDRFDIEAIQEFLTDLGETLRFGAEDVTALLADCGFRHARTTTFAELALNHTGTYDPAMGFHAQRLTIASAQCERSSSPG